MHPHSSLHGLWDTRTPGLDPDVFPSDVDQQSNFTLKVEQFHHCPFRHFFYIFVLTLP